MFKNPKLSTLCAKPKIILKILFVRKNLDGFPQNVALIDEGTNNLR